MYKCTNKFTAYLRSLTFYTRNISKAKCKTSASPLGLYSLRSRTSYRKISRSLEAARFMFKLNTAAEMRVKFQSDTIETSRDLAVRRLTA